MKLKFLYTLILFLPLLAAVSCSESPKIRIGVSQCNSDDWRSKMNDEILLELTQHPEVKAEILSGEDDNAKQISDIDHFIKEKVDVLIVSPREAAAISPSITRAREAGIKVLVFDRETDNEDYDLYYGANNAEIGAGAARYMLHRQELGSAAVPLNILEVRGLDDSSPATARREGFRRIIETSPTASIIASIGSNWTDSPTDRLVDSVLRVHPEINAIYAHNDRMALAAYSTAEKLGRNDLMIIGIDGAPQIGLKGVEQKKLDATFLYPTAGAEVVRNAIALAEGKELPKRIISDMVIPVDSTNVTLMRFSSDALTESIDQVKGLNSRILAFSKTSATLRGFLWVGLGLLVVAAGIVFVILRLYWARKRSQELLAARNETLRTQKEDLSRLNSQLQTQKEDLSRLNEQLIRQKEDLSKLNEQLNEATASKLNFFTNVSHDLRTPLTLISAPVDTLQQSPRLNSDEKGLLNLAAKNVRILRRLINQILDFQKFDSGKLRLDLTTFDIRLAVGEWTDAFRSTARQRDIRLSYDPTVDPDNVEGATLVRADREKLERVFFNLMSNAFRFTPANGRIKVRLDLTDPRQIGLSICDSGKGIASDQLPHLFERFYQGREGKGAGGSGIGLAVVKSFVELHGGSVGVESKEGEGTTFSITIPRRADEIGATAESVSERPTQGRADASDPLGTMMREVSAETGTVEIAQDDEIDDSKPTLLIVDDNDDMRALLKTLLRGDWQVLTAPDGEGGVRLANRYVPDCILCDVMMPGIDGLEVTRRLKSDTITSHIPILLLTACALDEQRAEGYESGADGYMPKPFDERVLKSRVRSLVENRRRIKEHDATGFPQTAVTEKKLKQNRPEKRDSSDPFSEIDSAFYRQFISMVEQEMGNAELSVEDMAARMGMSRVQLYRKMKALTNYSPADLLRLFRLRKAKELLAAADEMTVAEIAYQVGFSSPSYFSKCFREQFGELPSEWQGRTAKI